MEQVAHQIFGEREQKLQSVATASWRANVSILFMYKTSKFSCLCSAWLSVTTSSVVNNKNVWRQIYTVIHGKLFF